MIEVGDYVSIERGFNGSINDPDVGKIAEVVSVRVFGEGDTRYELKFRYENNEEVSKWWKELCLELIYKKEPRITKSDTLDICYEEFEEEGIKVLTVGKDDEALNMIYGDAAEAIYQWLMGNAMVAAEYFGFKE